jgi:glycerol kinase
MSADCILAIDQGTTNTKALLVDASGAIVARASRRVGVHYPRPAWVEQDPRGLWSSVLEAIDACLSAASVTTLAAVAIANQRETILLWDRQTGEPLGPAIVWQCHRSAPFCQELSARGLEPLIRERTGLTIDPMFSAAKARWLLAHTPDGSARAARGELCLGTVDSWLLWNLTGGTVHACDVTNASRTQLFNIHTLSWDAELADLFGVPLAALPRVEPSSTWFGATVALNSLPANVPVASMIGDSHAALFGHAAFGPGAVKATYGTGSSLMAPTPTAVQSKRGLSTTVAWARDRLDHVTYALEGNIYATGAAVAWLADVLGRGDSADGIEQLASQVSDTAGVYFVPALVGLGAPHWNDAARGLISGLVGGTRPAHLARATLESIAYQVRDVLDALVLDVGLEPGCLLADGGGSRNNLLMQIQADIVGLPVIRSASAELSALGAAWLAGLAIGQWSSEDELKALAPAGDRFEPRLSAVEREAQHAGWQQAVACTLFDATARAQTRKG